MRKKMHVQILSVIIMVIFIGMQAYSAIDKSAPYIKSSFPYKNQTNVSVTSSITVKFNENLVKGSSFSKITLTDNTKKNIEYTASISGLYLLVKPISTLSYSSQYKLSVPASAVKDKAGNKFKTSWSMIFNTQKDPKTISDQNNSKDTTDSKDTTNANDTTDSTDTLEKVVNDVWATDGGYVAYKAASAPEIDGLVNEECWNKATWMSLDKIWDIRGAITKPTPDDFTGRFKVTWTKDKLYLLAEITDDKLVDTHTNPVVTYWDDDCLEFFIDEDNSGGDHSYNFNAFAYHMSINYTVADYSPDTRINGLPVLLNDNVKYKITGNGTKYIWEAAFDIYDDTFSLKNSTNKKVILSDGKKIGFALAYCDSDSNRRDHFMGSKTMPEGQDLAWQTASSFGVLLLKN